MYKTAELNIMEKKNCFGVLENVFPVGETGLREIEPECFECPHKVPCLKEAMATKEGLKMREELVDRAADRGLMGRFQRWYRKKELDRISKKDEKKRKRWWK